MDNKSRKRLHTIVQSGLRQLGVPLLNLLISIWVVRQAGVATWGAFAYVALTVVLAEQLFAWGGQGLLLAQATASPARLGSLWWRWFIARLPLLGICLLILPFLPESVINKPLVACWLFGSYVQRSFEIFVTWRKDFGFSLVTEIIATALVLVGLILIETTATHLVFLYALTHACKALLYFARYRKSLTFKGSPQGLLAQGFWFFLPGFLGLMQVRMGVYVVALLLDPVRLGTFHILANLLLRTKDLATFIFMPFIKEFYRAPAALRAKYHRWGRAFGITLSPLCALGAYFLLTYVYHIPLPPIDFLLVGLYALPFFSYLLHIHYLMGRSLRRRVALVEGLALLLHTATCFLFIPTFGLTGALAAAVITQWFMWPAYWRCTIHPTPSDKAPQT